MGLVPGVPGRWLVQPFLVLPCGGPLRVHTLGWGTWNAEFTLMTGVPHTWFSGGGFYSPYTVAPRIEMALGRHLTALGYRTIGILPDGTPILLVEALWVADFVVKPALSTGKFAGAKGSWVMYAQSEPFVLGSDDPLLYSWQGEGAITFFRRR